ncbi:MAG: universal stress protein [Rhodospirillaceae bacterium]
MALLKTILVPLTGDTLATHVVDAAFHVAALNDGHIIGTHTVGDPLVYGGYLGLGMSGAYHEELYKAAHKVTTHLREQAQAAFNQVCEKQSIKTVERPTSEPGVSGFWLPLAHTYNDPVSTVGRVVDLVVVDQPREVSSFNETQALEAALFHTGNPVLMVPKETAHFEPKHAAIAWNGSIPASRALSASLDLIKHAEIVSIIQIGDVPEGKPDANLASARLGWHDIKSVIHRIEDDDKADGVTLLNTCKDLSADLIVMGAYARSPLREVVFGGMTRHVISHSDIPVLFAH